MDYQQTLNFLFARLPMYQRVGAAALKFNLDNVIRLLEKLDNPHKKIKTIHIAGTNGKGSSAHMIASVFQTAGYKTGLFTSPHLKSFTERIKINGHEIARQAVIDFVEEIEPVIEDIKPSFFEITFAMAMQYFHQQGVDAAIVEVGLGGRLDSTNIITPQACLITNISLDHQQFLGTTLLEIASEKAGIMKPEVPTIISERQPEIARVFVEKAEELACQLIFADEYCYLEQAANGRYNIIVQGKVFIEGLQPELKGGYQHKNIIGAIALLQLLNREHLFTINEEDIQQGVENTVKNTGLKGRWQTFNARPLTIADTGHNKAGIGELMKEINLRKFKKLHLVWGMVDDKNTGEILQMLPSKATFYFVQANIPRALKLSTLLEAANQVGLHGQGYDSVMEGYLAALKNAAADDMIFIGGSTFVVAEIDDL